MMKPLYLPLVKGIQDADADSAEPQTGKLADAVNVHVHPEQLNALSLRPRFVGKAAIDADSRLCVADGEVAYSNGTAFARFGRDGTYNSVATSARFFAVESISKSTLRGNDAILSQGYAEQANGDSIVVVSQGNVSTTGFRTYYQLTVNGQRQPESVLGSANASLPARLWVFPRGTNTGWVMMYGDNVGNLYITKSTSNGGVIPPSVTTVGSLLGTLDIVKDSNGNYARLQSDTFGTALRIFTENGAAVGSAIVVDAKISAKYGGLVEIGAGVFHVWVGGFPVDGNDGIYVYRVTISGAVVTLLGSVATVLTVAIPTRIAVGGGSSIKITSSTNGAGSYCYLTGGNGSAMRVARLLLCDNATITHQTYTAPILPFSRIWADTTFFGARMWGSQISVTGCWELTPTSTAANDVVRCIPLTYLTVTGANIAADSDDAVRNYSCVHGTNYSVCAIPNKEYAVSVARLGFNSPTRGSTVTSSNFDVMMTGVPRYWDGVNLVPAGIPQAPTLSSVSVSPGTGTVPAGTYLYSMVWEWFDATGRRQQSPTQLGTAVVAGVSSVSLEIHPGSIPYDERLLGTRPALRGVVYRSDAGGTILKRGALYLEFTTVGPSSGLFGSTQFVVIDDGTVDFSTGEPLYTSAGGANELPATALEECYLMRPYSDRIIGVSMSFPDQLWYTKTIQVARGIEANQALYFRLPEIATGLAVQDGNIYWFSERNCWAFVPQFADDTGVGGGAVDPVPLATGVGCTATNSIVETPVGVFFIGPRGPWVIPRGGGAPTFVGLDVEEHFREFPTCRGAVYNPLFSEIVFAMESSSPALHCLIIYNHVTEQWYRWMIGHDALAASGGALLPSIAQGIVYAGGVLAVGGGVAGAAGSILHLTDDGGATDDFLTGNDRWIHPYVETKNFYPSGGPSELFRANRYTIDCSSTAGDTLQLSASADDGTTWQTAFALSTASQANPPICRFAVQKVRGIRMRWYTTWNSQVLPANQDHAPNRYNGVTLYSSPLGRAKAGSAYYRG